MYGGGRGGSRLKDLRNLTILSHQVSTLGKKPRLKPGYKVHMNSGTGKVYGLRHIAGKERGWVHLWSAEEGRES